MTTKFWLAKDVAEKLLALSNRLPIFVAGGSVRDALLGRESKDLDLTVASGAEILAKELAESLGGKLVPLDEEEGVYRIALPEGHFLDLSAYRKGSRRLEEDLTHRDFTINALAVSVEEFLKLPPHKWQIIDPTGGLKDLSRRLLRAISLENLKDDPLRVLRGYRLAAELGFEIEPQTRLFLKEASQRLNQVARERIGSEIKTLFAQRAGSMVSLMAEDEVLFVVFPELKETKGVKQPSFHHLDVFGHLLLSLEMADLILEEPGRFLGIKPGEDPFCPLRHEENQQIVRLASLFHDIGKPRTFAIRHRITFYEHDRVGASIFEALGQRLKWSKKFVREVSLLIRHHMRPFHLLREFRVGRLTKRAMRRLLKDVPNYVALFAVAMADSLASAGPDKEEGLEAELSALFWEIHRFREEEFTPQQRERLVTGRDLIEHFGLEPGPIFRELLEAVEEARAEGEVRTREEALNFLAALIAQRFKQV